HAVPRVVTLPPGDAGEARPTAVVHDNAERFRASDGERVAACSFIVVGASGTVTCWTPAETPLDAAICAFDGAASGAVYTGAAIGRRRAGLALFAVDFHNGRIDAFDQAVRALAMPGGFGDPALPVCASPVGV